MNEIESAIEDADGLVADWLRELVEELGDAEDALSAARDTLAAAETKARAEAVRVAAVRRVHGLMVQRHPSGISYVVASRFASAVVDRHAGFVKQATEAVAAAETRVSELSRAIDEIEDHLAPAPTSGPAASPAPAASPFSAFSPVVGAAPAPALL